MPSSFSETESCFFTVGRIPWDSLLPWTTRERHGASCTGMMVCLKVGFPGVPSLSFSVKSSHCRLSNMALTLLSSVLISVSLESTYSGSLVSQAQCIKIAFRLATHILLTTETTDIIWFNYSLLWVSLPIPNNTFS